MRWDLARLLAANTTLVGCVKTANPRETAAFRNRPLWLRSEMANNTLWNVPKSSSYKPIQRPSSERERHASKSKKIARRCQSGGARESAFLANADPLEDLCLAGQAAMSCTSTWVVP